MTAKKAPPESNSDLEAIERRLTAIEQRLETIQDHVGRRGAETHFYHLQLAVQSLVRQAFLNAASLPFPERLLAQRFRLRSQNYEDGITQAIFGIAGAPHRTAIEIGCGVNGGNSGFLVAECAWRGLFLDGDASKVETLRGTLSRERAVIASGHITAGNVNDLIRQHGFAGEVDLVSIDIDGVDYWIWRALEIASPRVVIMEYNSAFGPDASVTVPYEPEFSRKKKRDRLYFGASLRALAGLASSKGYRLVAVESRGVNAFFVRNDVAPEIPACSVPHAYRLLEKHGIALRGRSSEELVREFMAAGLVELPA